MPIKPYDTHYNLARRLGAQWAKEQLPAHGGPFPVLAMLVQSGLMAWGDSLSFAIYEGFKQRGVGEFFDDKKVVAALIGEALLSALEVWQEAAKQAVRRAHSELLDPPAAVVVPPPEDSQAVG